MSPARCKWIRPVWIAQIIEDKLAFFSVPEYRLFLLSPEHTKTNKHIRKLVGGLNPSEKYESIWMILPNRKNKSHLPVTINQKTSRTQFFKPWRAQTRHIPRHPPPIPPHPATSKHWETAHDPQASAVRFLWKSLIKDVFWYMILKIFFDCVL